MIGPTMLVQLGLLNADARPRNRVSERAHAIEPSTPANGNLATTACRTIYRGQVAPCDACGTAGVAMQPNRFTAWCPQCRRVFLSARGRVLCRLPNCWSIHAFAGFLHSGLTANGAGHVDLAFTRFMCVRLGIAFDEVASIVLTAPPQHTTIGALAVQHGLLTPNDVAWVIEYQQTQSPARRRLFGEIAVSLGLWPEGILAPLLTLQAERSRGFSAALAEHVHLTARDVRGLERGFFGLSVIDDRADRLPITQLIGERRRCLAA